MPIHECALPGGGRGWQWGSGKCYPRREQAEAQAEAAYANGYAGDRMALDRSNRTIDVDGRLFVEDNPISKANVCPYFGMEIPDHEALGLEPNRIYQLLRAPEELEKAAPTFRNLPILMQHKPTSADDHPREITVGSTGTDVVFEMPYLKCSLNFWDKEAIAGIETKAQTQLSSGYRYRADMTPGVFAGVAYDGVMRDIIGNHVALVDIGRAGPDVVVGDKNPFFKRKQTMKKLTPMASALYGALRVYLTPKLATDAAPIALRGMIEDVSAKNFPEKRAEIKKQLATLTHGKLASDASLEDLDRVLDALSGEEDEVTADEVPDEDEDEWEDDPENPGQKRKKVKPATDEPATPEGGEIEEKEGKVDKQAMDAAIKKARDDATAQARAEAHALYQAREEVAPLVGKVGMDSAEAVYRFALDKAGVDHKNVHASALPVLVKMAVDKAKPQSPVVIAEDRDSVNDLRQAIPNLNRFKHA